MATPLKHGLGRSAVARLARNIERAWPAFDSKGFTAASMRGLARLELKPRVGHIATRLAAFLPGDYAKALAIVVRASKTWDRGDEGDPLRGFAAWPLFHFIEHYGTGDFTRSMAAVRSMTHLFSAEFAIRPFIARYPRRAFAELQRWTTDSSEHVRRLASEGARPRLPWATRVPALIDDPSPVLALLDGLKDDPALYVRRSVANNLNDIAKDHPDRVLDLCETWLDGASAERRWIVRHATRSLVKAGHPRVWALLGFTRRPQVTVSEIVVSPRRVRVGDDVSFTFELASTARVGQRLVVDYAMHFVKASGAGRPKVFKLKVVQVAPRQVTALSCRHSFRKISTRTYYPGLHAIEVLVNGNIEGRAEFALVPAR
jgi:3-methyladenine DNA glycosylase AlkC